MSGAAHPRSCGDPVRPPTPEEMRAVGHPTRLRIIRLCHGAALTNQELAARLGLAPGTVLRHVRMLVATGFLEPQEVRSGPKGALERPYRTTGLSMRLAWDAAGAPELLQQVDFAMLHAYRSELVESGPDSVRDSLRTTLRLSPDAQRELRGRLRALVEEFAARDEPGGENLGLLWMLHATAEPPPA